MKFIKTHLFPIICGVIILACIVALFYPIGSMAAKLRKAMSHELTNAQMAQQLGRTSLHIPGGKRFVGPVTPALIKQRLHVQRYIESQSKGVKVEYIALNARGRIEFNSEDRIIGGFTHSVPLLAGMPMPGILPEPPKFLTVRRAFRMQYRRLFLNNKSVHYCFLSRLDAGMPPSAKSLDRMIKSRLKQMGEAMPEGFQNSSSTNAAEKRSLQSAIVQQQVFMAAAKCKVYADRGSFQERDFVLSRHLPTAAQMYEAFVDSWIQSDIVNAIVSLNHGSRNVSYSPVKRLIHITVGTNAPGAYDANAQGRISSPTLVPDGGLFLGGGGTANPSMNMQGGMPRSPQFGYGGPPVQPGNGANTGAAVGAILTHHVSNARHQVVLVAVSAVVEADKINAFINQIYRQNNGYTVLQLNMKTVDPIRAISEGFVYGKVPVVRINMLMEDLLCTQWNEPLMPPAIRAGLGLRPISMARP